MSDNWFKLEFLTKYIKSTSLGILKYYIMKLETHFICARFAKTYWNLLFTYIFFSRSRNRFSTWLLKTGSNQAKNVREENLWIGSACFTTCIERAILIQHFFFTHRSRKISTLLTPSKRCSFPGRDVRNKNCTNF